MWPPFTRDDLRAAADVVEFDSILPLMIRQLIAETASGLTEIDMPGGSGTASGGFDGVAVASGSTAFVPAGTSAWELSVEKSTKAKADADYEKRTHGPNGESCAEVTYVQVILRPWTKAREWRNARNHEGRWKEVRAYNLDSVHTWLESAPATTTWLVNRLGKRLPGVMSADDWWDEQWLPSTHIPLSAEVVLAGRETMASELVKALAPGRLVTIGGGLRADDLRAFVSATFQLSTDIRVESLRTRTLFVDSIESMAQLMSQKHPLVLVVPDPSWLSSVAVRDPHTVIVAALPGQAGVPDVPAVDSEAVARKLAGLGAPDERAHSWGLLARRSLLALRRALAINPVLLTPSWARTPSTAQRRILLLGGWEGTNAEDRALAARAVGLTYDDLQEIATSLAGASDVPFLGRFREQWHLLAPEDAWTLLRVHIVQDDLNALRAASLEVFGSEHGTRFSATSRSGLARTLALLGALGEGVRLTGGSTGREFCRAIVGELLGQANADPSYGHWTSLCDVLPLLAEAAPSEFIDALRHGLVSDEPLHRHMFQDAEQGEFGFAPPSTHNHVLWALQAIAWSEDYFPEVIDLLARLAAIDPGGRWATRPDTALLDMMSCWRPSTAAHEQARRTGLRQLMRMHPTVTRRLLIALIPSGREFQIPAVKPEFRDWVRPIVVTHADALSTVGFVIEVLLDDLGDETDRHLSLLTKFEALPLQYRRTFVDKLSALGTVVTADADRSLISDAVRKKVAHHREYADTQWALPEAELLLLEQAGQALTPTSVVRRERWLFDSDPVELGDVTKRDDFVAYEAAVSARRVDAVAAIVEVEGIQALADLADDVSYPYVVGFSLARHSQDFDQTMIAWLHTASRRQQAARGYLRARLRGEDAAASDRLLVHTDDPAIKAEILHAVDDPRKAWEKLPDLGEEVTRSYWAGFVYYGLGQDFSGVEHAAHNLTEVGRVAAALQLIALYSKRVTSLEAAEIAASACEALLTRDEPDPETAQLSEHSFRRIMSLLAPHKDSLGLSRVAFLEWNLFPALGFDAQAPILHAALQEDPTFFADLVSRVFRANDEARSAEVGSPQAEHRRALAERAYEVLRSWTQSPGLGTAGLVETNLLQSWVTRAREALQENGRPTTGDLMIGQALAHAPPDTEGLFPPQAVRDLLEDLRADHIERGLEVGIVNRRGVTSRGMTDGGAQEWELAANYRRDALAASQWPRTKKMLSRLAECYEHEARREDDEAERLRRGLPE